MRYIDCEKYAKEILDEVKKVKHDKYFMIVSVGDNPASQSYIKGKIKDCEYCGIPYVHKHIDLNTETDPKIELEYMLRMASYNKNVGAIILQLPLPNGWDEEYFSNLISPSKDVDGLVANSSFEPCTPEGIVYVLKKELGSLEGKTALVIGRGKLVGRPLFDLLLNENCTVTMAHSKTKDLLSMLLLDRYDIVIVAAGRAGVVGAEYVSEGQTVIDVGINVNEEGKLCGDCDYAAVEPIVDAITPVPGGVGSVTTSVLVGHVVEAAMRKFA